MKKLSLRVIAGLMFVLPATQTFAENTADSICYESVCFPRTIGKEEGLTARGVAHYRYWGFSLYTAALYTEDLPVLDADGLIRKQAGELRIRYERGFSTKDFIASGDAFVKKNPAFNVATMAEPLRIIDGLYKLVKPGDEYQITFKKGEGFELSLNGEKLGEVPGEEFARIYMGIWLSAKYGLDSGFSAELMGAGR